MIASIRGILNAKTPNQVVVDVQGLGYLVHVTPNTATNLKIGVQISLFTSMVVREDAMTLFGFNTSLEQELFDLLRSVTGVGPKSALAILGAMTTGEIAAAVALDDDASFRAVSGIGPKTAKLITVTLSGKLSHLVLVEPHGLAAERDFGSVVEALVSLGWPEKSAQEAVKGAASRAKSSDGRDVILRQALSDLGSNKSTLAVDK